MQAETRSQIEIDLDVQLKEDRTGEFKKELLQQLEAQQAEIKNVLNKGCAPDDYTLYQELLAATATAKEVIELVWSRFH